DPNYNIYKDIDQIPKHIFDEMSHFFTVYKELEHKATAVNEVENADSAKRIISEDIERYIENFCK
ncbi:MAG: inorganic diphosphatase, partial [Ruminococcus sp.]|nr:inorganic diphosphatase [Ruminococcus sp.]